jgi:hypothetical protein
MNRIPAAALCAGLCLAMALPGVCAAQTAPSKRPAAKPAAVPPASDEQLAAADAVLYGDYVCAAGPGLSVTRELKYPGYVNVRFNRLTYLSRPLQSPTGAVRIEDVKGRGLVVQIASKSMLLDTRTGRRLADDCVHERQREAHDKAAAAAAAPASEAAVSPPQPASAASGL